MKSDHGEIILYQSTDGEAAIDVHLKDETVWLSQVQMVELFQRDQSVISRHVNNVFEEGELERESNMQKVHIANSDIPQAASDPGQKDILIRLIMNLIAGVGQ